MRLRKQLVRLRGYLITGLIVSTPIFITGAVLLWLFRRLDNIFGPQLRVLLGRDVPGAGLIVLVILLLLVGWASRRALGRRLVARFNAVLSRFPLTRQIYNASSQIVQAVLDREEKLFQGCALVEYPMKGSYSLGFVTAEAPPQVEKTMGEPAISVFLPTAPNPTSGYLLLLPATRVHLLDITVEEGLKMVVSAGVATPGGASPANAGLDLKRLLRETGDS